MNFITGVIFGIVISTVGFSGIAQLADTGIHQIQSIAKGTIK